MVVAVFEQEVFDEREVGGIQRLILHEQVPWLGAQSRDAGLSFKKLRSMPFTTAFIQRQLPPSLR